jgi:Skp family chaperone for outer membrane proteins
MSCVCGIQEYKYPIGSTSAFEKNVFGYVSVYETIESGWEDFLQDDNTTKTDFLLKKLIREVSKGKKDQLKIENEKLELEKEKIRLKKDRDTRQRLDDAELERMNREYEEELQRQQREVQGENGEEEISNATENDASTLPFYEDWVRMMDNPLSINIDEVVQFSAQIGLLNSRGYPYTRRSGIQYIVNAINEYYNLV